MPRRYDNVSGLKAGDGIQPDKPGGQGRRGIFRKDGEFWTVGYAEGLIHIKDSKGLAYIVQLLRNPNMEFHVLELIGTPTDGLQSSVPEADESAAGTGSA